MSLRYWGVPGVLSVGAVAAAVPLWRRLTGPQEQRKLTLDPVARREAVGKNRTGVIVLNIGSPKSTSTPDVRHYLSRFLGDDRVLDIKPAWTKWLVLKLILLTRPAQSAESYKFIWDKDRGFPLVYLTNDLCQRLQDQLGDEYNVKAGMSYSDPDIAQVMADFAAEGTTRVVVVPNYPNYASSSTGSSLQDVYNAASKSYVVPNLSVVPPFFRQPGFLKVWTRNIGDAIGKDRENAEHLVISFHGVPERHCTACDPTGDVCQKSSDCCATLGASNAQCYRAQCFETARRIAKELDLPDDYWEIAFQSRLTLRGRIKWIEPYTDVRMEVLAKEGKKKVAICAPSFSIDCLETLHELQVENLEYFQEAGGEELLYIGCPNADPEWVAALAEVVKEATPKDLSW